MTENTILYEDNEVIVCHKPSGVAVETARLSEKDMVSMLKSYLPRSNAPYLGVIHRLDQPVEGIIVFAKTKDSAAHLSKQLQQFQMTKLYKAVICPTTPLENTGRITLVDYLKKDGKTNKSHVVSKNDKEGKRAELSYEILKSHTKNDFPNLALAQILLVTGRHHQIRVQLSHAGMPLAGDEKYYTQESKKISETLGFNSTALCACELHFMHPVSHKKLSFSIQPANPAFSLIFPENS